MTAVAVETIEGIDLEHTPPCDAVVNGLPCRDQSEYRITFFCCGSRVVFLCQRCYIILQVNRQSACLYCDARITEWRIA